MSSDSTADDILALQLHAERKRVTVLVKPEDTTGWVECMDTETGESSWTPRELMERISAAEMRRRGIPDESISAAMSHWMASISEGTKRMSEDEAYRLQIAKDLS
jgi:hypothetical protein